MLVDIAKQKEAIDGEAAKAWTALSGKITFYLRTRFGNCSFPPGIEFNDFLSDMMAKVMSSIHSFEDRGKDSFWRWVQTIGGNLWRDMWRRFQRDREHGLVGRGEHSTNDSESRPPSAATGAVSPGESVTQIVRFRELERAERECATRLTKTMREVYELRRLHDLPFAEISEKMGGINEATLRSHYMRARDQIRNCLGTKIDEMGKKIRGW
jgi:RNA polymerase sigma factor (sigma-70 family)